MERQQRRFVFACVGVLGAGTLTRFCFGPTGHDAAETHIVRANALVKTGHWTAGTAELEQAVALEPGNFEAREGLSYLYVSTRRLSEAIQTLEQGMRIMPRDRARYCTALCEIYVIEKNYPQAIRHVRMSLEIQPNDAFEQRRLGMLLERAAEWKQAEDVWQSYLRQHPDDAFAARGLNRVRKRSSGERLIPISR